MHPFDSFGRDGHHGGWSDLTTTLTTKALAADK
jgi:hypothetical protein